MKVKVFSDGTPFGTRVYNAVNGEVVPGVISVQFLHPEESENPRVMLLLEGVEVEVQKADAEVETEGGSPFKKGRRSRKGKDLEADDLQPTDETQ